MTFFELKAALQAAGWRVYKDGAPSGDKDYDYIVMSTYLPRRLRGDDETPLWWSRCQLDCYSQEDGADLEGGAFVFILNTLDDAGVPFSMESCAYDNDAATMRMIIQCDVF